MCFIPTVLKLLTSLQIIVRQIKLDFLSKCNTKGLKLKTNLKRSPNIKSYAFFDKYANLIHTLSSQKKYTVKV